MGANPGNAAGERLEGASSRAAPRVTELSVYPIKSCGPVRVERAVVERRGLAGDRRYMLVDARGRFLSQRRAPRMALIHVAHTDGGLRVTAPDAPPLELPRALETDAWRLVRIWQDEVAASLADATLNDWFSRVLGSPLQLVYMGETHERALQPGRGQPGDPVSFADGAPLLLISEASLAALNERLPEPVTMQRFRPNIVVTADRPFVEDGWRSVRIGAAEFDVAWPSTRCVLTTVDPATGAKDPSGEPLATLRTFRRARQGVLFGQNLIPRRLGTVKVGDTVELLEIRGVP